VMSNHFHIVLRVRPDLAQGWSDDEVALRWRLLYPSRDEKTGLQSEPEQHDLDAITSDPERVAQLRYRLASLSWFMRCRNEPIVRATNKEDKCSGRFWKGRSYYLHSHCLTNWKNADLLEFVVAHFTGQRSPAV
jgi:hypothetical protein